MARQFLRRCFLSLSGASSLTIPGGRETDLRIEAQIAASTLLAPNSSRFRITNPSPQTIAAFSNKEYQQIRWDAGYEENCAFIFGGDIKQSIYAHAENVVDSYIDIFAYESGNAHQQARVNATLAAGWTPRDKLDLALQAMKPFGISSLGFVNVDLSQPVYPRGRPFVGLARDLIREVALSAGALPSMSGGKLHLIDHSKPLQSDGPIVLNSKTGQGGFAQQTTSGIVARCLINPAIKVHTQVRIDESSVIQAEKDNGPFGGPSEHNRELNNTGQIAADGLYRVIYYEVDADTRGTPWYQTLTCLAVTAGATVNEGQLHAGFN